MYRSTFERTLSPPRSGMDWRPIDEPPPRAAAGFALHVLLGFASLGVVGLGALDWLGAGIDWALGSGPRDVRHMSVAVPVVEELAKALMLGAGLIVLASLPALRIRTTTLPALVVPSAGIGVGFGVLETLVLGDGTTPALALLALVIRCWAHTVCMLVWTGGVALAVLGHGWGKVPLAFGLAVGFHGVFNFLSGLASLLWLLVWSLAVGLAVGLASARLRDWPVRRRAPWP